MARLLTTKGIGHFLEELFKSSKEFVYIVTPYIQIDRQVEERISDALDSGLKVVLIYGKKKGQLTNFGIGSQIDLYYHENLHAKFYMNEKHALITSMNMHTYSEATNREIGVLFSKKDAHDNLVITDCLREFESIKRNSQKITSDAPLEASHLNHSTVIEQVNPTAILNSKYYKIVISILTAKLGVENEEVIPEANFMNDLDADSLDLVELLMEVEKEFGISISDEDAEKITTVSKLVLYLEQINATVREKNMGYCIRTGTKIPFNIEKPLSLEAFKQWNKFQDPNYPEKFCHYSGESSNGGTCINRPILKKNWKKALDHIESKT